MSRYRFSPAQRFAILSVHGGRCYICTKPVSLPEMQVDHVVPEALEDDPTRLRKAKQQLELADGFSVNSYANWLPACGPCNRKKSDVPFDPAPIVLLSLREAGSKAAQVEARVERVRRQPSLDRTLAALLEAAGASGLGRDEWLLILEFLAREGPGSAEPLHLAPGLSVVPARAEPDAGGRVVAEHGDLRLMEAIRSELGVFREEQSAANREFLERLDRLSDASRVLDARPSLADAIAGNRAGRLGLGRGVTVLDAARVAEAFGAASDALLGWPQETDGRWLARPELATLRAALDDPEGRPTVLLGGPGSGKSALLARLGGELRAEGVALLALKADRIDRAVSTLRDLEERHLPGAPGPVLDCLVRVAAEGRAVLLIDQLDALAELMDRHTGRLSALLALVNGARRIANLRIVLSCREFDFRRDARLTTLRAAEAQLGQLAWENVAPLLEARGLRPAAWTDEFREALRTPQHLNLFLTHLAGRGPDRAYAGYQDMLEEVFRRRVLDAHGPPAAEAAYRVAEAMAEDEELWVPAARFDGRRPEVDALLAEGVLMAEEGGRRLGFRHQTLFDFVRARAFVAGGASVADHVLARQDALFVRPVAWSALNYLRAADPAGYRRELGRLWSAPALRTHLRLLLVELLGQQRDPCDREAAWLLPVVDGAGRPGRRALLAAAGSPGWFDRLRPRLPALMASGDAATVWAVVEVLRRAAGFARDEVLELLEAVWLEPLRAAEVFRVIEDLGAWDDRAMVLAEAVSRSTDVHTVVLRKLTQSISRAAPDLAPRLVAARLAAGLDRARVRRGHGPEADGEDTAEIGEGYETSLRRVLDDQAAWHGQAEVARRSPAVFVTVVWPWVHEIAADLAWAPRLGLYRVVRFLEFADGDGDDDRAQGLPGALAAAVEAWADLDPDGFLGFAAGAWASDLMPAHRLLARGLARLAPARPGVVLDYLLGDPRRLALGDYSDAHADTCRLIASVASHLDDAGLDRLVRAVLGWRRHADEPDDDARSRRETWRWNRECRRRLLAAIPAEHRPPEIARLLEEEGRALGPAREPRSRLLVPSVGPTMTTGQMARARDADILGLFDELVDVTGRDHPRDSMRSGSIQASQQFAGLAKTDPSRVVRLLDALSPGRHERPVGYALDALGEAEALEPMSLVALVHRLHSRSFSAAEFKSGAASALGKAASRLEGLGDRACALLESWLGDAAGPTLGARNREEREAHGSVLWHDGGLRLLPGGNYPILHALMLGHLLRRPMAADAWLGVLERHLARREEREVWQALAPDLRFLANADRDRAAHFVRRLLRAVEGLADSVDGAGLLAWTHRWLPLDLSHAHLDRWRDGPWPLGPQAAGEFALLRHLLVPEDAVVAALCGEALSAADATPTVTLAGFRLGMAHTAARLWREDELRPAATPFWTGLAAVADAEAATALLDVFRRGGSLPRDGHARSLLLAVVEHPALLEAGGDPMFLVNRLKEALRDGHEPRLVASAASGIVARGGAELADMSTRWAGSAGDLVEIALSLQRLPETREEGTALFERLMEVGTYEAEQALLSLDRRGLR